MDERTRVSRRGLLGGLAACGSLLKSVERDASAQNLQTRQRQQELGSQRLENHGHAGLQNRFRARLSDYPHRYQPGRIRPWGGPRRWSGRHCSGA